MDCVNIIYVMYIARKWITKYIFFHWIWIMSEKAICEMDSNTGELYIQL